jgi:hypothetical protein
MNTVPTLQNDAPYAYAFARAEHDFAEIKIALRRIVTGSFSYLFSSELVMRCYVSREFDTPYGVKLVLDGGHQMEMAELTAAMKVMTSIAKKLKKMEDELGYTNDRDLPEFARRVLVASGIRTVFYERKFNQGAVDRNGLTLKDGIFGLPSVDPRDGKDFLFAIRGLTDDTLEKRGMKKEPA